MIHTMVCLWLAAVVGVPALSDGQRAQLDTATDGSRQLDEGALYPLLENMLAFEPGDMRGARVPDYEAIRADPAAARGELYLIRGQFIGTTPRHRLTRRGAWGDALTGWGVVVSPEPPAVVVYFVDPAGELDARPPRYGAEVELVGRFYKVWADRDADGRAWEYLTFVARSAEVISRGAGGGPGRGMGGSMFVVMLMMLGALLFVLWRVRGMVRPRVAERPRRELDEPGLAAAGEEEQAPLPNDPEAALAELARRRGEA
ncbi:hypothetical protein ACERK3_01075 [Phycisphaerales bacterium AB-hyl4]|uniref:Uncharacterized protein n=1 Tax=Natronomicrosphaera hydrolytica TaxID=3242702 RepID=A0ABV4U338_9BACT